jgi:hypothetical protein
MIALDRLVNDMVGTESSTLNLADVDPELNSFLNARVGNEEDSDMSFVDLAETAAALESNMAMEFLAFDFTMKYALEEEEKKAAWSDKKEGDNWFIRAIKWVVRLLKSVIGSIVGFFKKMWELIFGKKRKQQEEKVAQAFVDSGSMPAKEFEKKHPEFVKETKSKDDEVYDPGEPTRINTHAPQLENKTSNLVDTKQTHRHRGVEVEQDHGEPSEQLLYLHVRAKMKMLTNENGYKVLMDLRKNVKEIIPKIQTDIDHVNKMNPESTSANYMDFNDIHNDNVLISVKKLSPNLNFEMKDVSIRDWYERTGIGLNSLVQYLKNDPVRKDLQDCIAIIKIYRKAVQTLEGKVQKAERYVKGVSFRTGNEEVGNADELTKYKEAVKGKVQKIMEYSKLLMSNMGNLVNLSDTVRKQVYTFLLLCAKAKYRYHKTGKIN